MKKKFIYIVLIILVFSLCSCKKKKTEEKYAELKTAFTVDSQISNNFIYQQNSKLFITGECIENGKIIATLYDENEVAFSTSYGVANEKGEYEIVIDTPSGSFKEYSLVLHDSNNRFFSSFYDILFGEVTLLLGDEIIDDPLPKDLTESTLDSLKNSLYIFDATETNPKWVSEFESYEISDFIYNYYNIMKKTSNFKNMPIAFVSIMFENTNIIGWLPQEEVKDNSGVLKYLQDTNQYFENPYELGQMSFIANNMLENLSNYAYSSVIYSSGVNDFSSYSLDDKEKIHIEMYSKLLLMTLKNIKNSIRSYNNFSIIQAPSADVENINILRNIQTKVSKYINGAVLIPTYDLYVEKNNTIPQLVLERYYEVINGKKVICDIANVIKKYEGDKLLTVSIEFNNTDALFFDKESLVILDLNGEKIELQLGKITSDKHIITINLSYTETSYENPDKYEVKYHEISSISYGQEQVFESKVIFSDNNIPILPFYVQINTLDEVE